MKMKPLNQAVVATLCTIAAAAPAWADIPPLDSVPALVENSWAFPVAGIALCVAILLGGIWLFRSRAIARTRLRPRTRTQPRVQTRTQTQTETRAQAQTQQTGKRAVV